MQKKLPEQIEKYYRLPLEVDHGEILDAKGIQVAQFLNYGIGERECLKKAIDGTSKKEEDFHFYVHNSIIGCKNKNTGVSFDFLLMRGWGVLTKESYFNLPPQIAVAIQKGMASYIVRLLNKEE